MSLDKIDIKSMTYDDKLAKILDRNYEYASDYGFYDPLMAGSIDGTDDKPHDHGIVRALNSSHYKPNLNNVNSDPRKTLFIGSLNYKTSESNNYLVYRNLFKCANSTPCRVRPFFFRII